VVLEGEVEHFRACHTFRVCHPVCSYYGNTSMVQFSYLDTRKVFKECGEGGVGTRLAGVYDSANTTSLKTLITYVRVTMLAPNDVAVDVFGTGIVH
jgi:hypothetical protein